MRAVIWMAQGKFVNADFNPDGNCNVNWNLKSQNVNSNLGVRSVVVSVISGGCLLYGRHLLFCGKLREKSMKKKVLIWIKIITSGPRLSKDQWLLLASFFKTIAEGMILGSSAAFFLPETFQLNGPILIDRYLLLLLTGLFFLVGSVIMTNRGR